MHIRIIGCNILSCHARCCNSLSKIDVDKVSERQLFAHYGCVLWFTGLTDTGKSIIANKLEKFLNIKVIRTYILDDDNVRLGLNSDLGFKDSERVENTYRVGDEAELMDDAEVVALTTFIFFFKLEREWLGICLRVVSSSKYLLTLPYLFCSFRP